MIATLSLCSCAREQQHEHQSEFYIFGTVLEVVTWGATDQQAEEAFAELQVMFNQMHQDWHAWEPGELVAINQAFADGRTTSASEDIVELISRSQEIEQKTTGRFNPAIGALIQLWGFHTSNFPIIGPPPVQQDIQSILDSHPSSLEIEVRGTAVRSTNNQVKLDFGGIAKGYAIDLACQRLRERGISNAIVNAGGDLRAFGTRGSRFWRLGIRSPAGGVIGGVEAVGDEAIFTSGVYERFRQDQQERYPHILDPRTGWPVENIAAVTVIAEEGLLADAAATALIVAGKTDWLKVSQALGLKQILLIDEVGQVYVTPEMNERVDFLDSVDPIVVDWD